jgi:hypothetical protein
MNIDVLKDRADFLAQVATRVYGRSPKNPSRKRECVWARTAVASTLREEGVTLQEIAKYFGKDHATIYVALNKHDDHLRLDKQYQQIYSKYEALIGTPETCEQFTKGQVRQRIFEITKDLRKLGLDWDAIEDFWARCLFEAKIEY